MDFYLSKSKFVAAYMHCNKYAWLEKYMPEQKAPVGEFTEALFENGHKVGALAQEYLRADVDVTVEKGEGRLDLDAMLRKTREHMDLGTPVIAEASFCFHGLFCSVDLLVRNPDGTYDLCEVKSSKQEKPSKKDPLGVKEKYVVDAAYQRYVLEQCGVPVRKVYVVLLARDYVRGSSLELDKYFVKCDVTEQTGALRPAVVAKLAELEAVLCEPGEPASVICGNCNKCDYFGYCGRNIAKPSPFDVYDLKFKVKCQYYQDGVSFFDIPKLHKKLNSVAQQQIRYYGKADLHLEPTEVRAFLDNLVYPLYSLDFETYLAVVPEHAGMHTYEQVPFQYSVHRIARPDPDVRPGSPDLEERSFLDLTGGDPRRALAESLVRHIPSGAHVVAYHHTTEKNIVERLAELFPDLAPHLRSFTYHDPLELFQGGHYYRAAMGGSLSLKSVAPAMYPEDPGMDYHNLEGSVKNGTQAMQAITKARELSAEELEQLRQDLETYCRLDTLAVVKIIKKLNEDAY